MEVLPDIAGPDPVVVLCGMAGCESGRLRDHYYETPGNAFWEFLNKSGLTPRSGSRRRRRDGWSSTAWR